MCLGHIADHVRTMKYCLEHDNKWYELGRIKLGHARCVAGVSRTYRGRTCDALSLSPTQVAYHSVNASIAQCK